MIIHNTYVHDCCVISYENFYLFWECSFPFRFASVMDDVSFDNTVIGEAGKYDIYRLPDTSLFFFLEGCFVCYFDAFFIN